MVEDHCVDPSAGAGVRRPANKLSSENCGSRGSRVASNSYWNGYTAMKSLRTRKGEKHEQESRSLKQESVPFTPRSLPILPLVLLIRTLKPAENCGGG